MVVGAYLKIVNTNIQKNMGLSLNQIKEILLRPQKRQLINKASSLQQRVRFHTETNISLFDYNSSAQLFLDWVSQLLPKDKYNIFVHLFQYPLPTSAVIDDVYRELERVFYSRNSSSAYQFTSSELLEDWLNYKKNVLHEPDIWKTEGWKQLQVSPNSKIGRAHV